MKVRTGDIIGLVLLAGVAACRFWTPAADFYAESCYPPVSAALSWVASWVKVSLEEIVVCGFALAFLGVLVRAVRKKEGFLKWMVRTLRIAVWLVVWLYMGWGNNYFRTPLYARMDITPAHFEQRVFERFLSEYTAALNADSRWEQADMEAAVLEREVREYYAGRAVDCGYTPLRKWQHVKKPLLNPLFSAVTVLGWMGPFFCESQVNLDLPLAEYPFTLAHELAHLSGVTGEGEANDWAYAFCRQSDNPYVRYSGHLSLLPYVAANARALLPEDRYEAWIGRIAEKVLDDNAAIQLFWDGKRVRFIEDAQRFIMNLFLKSNGISEGARDYQGVIGMIMTMDGYFGDSPSSPAKAKNRDLPRMTTQVRRQGPRSVWLGRRSLRRRGVRREGRRPGRRRTPGRRYLLEAGV